MAKSETQQKIFTLKFRFEIIPICSEISLPTFTLFANSFLTKKKKKKIFKKKTRLSVSGYGRLM